jgi:hypothetical protein
MTARSIARLGIVSAALLVHGVEARAQGIQINVNDDVNFKLGVLAQFQADTITDPPGDANSSNLFIRRVRLMFGGQVAKRVSFFIETDNPNLGKATPPAGKTTQSTTLVSTFIQDAYGEFKIDDRLMSVGAAFDTQKEYHAFVIDGMVDLPLGPGAVTVQANYNRFDGDIMFPALPEQHHVLAEAGYYISALKLEPVLQYNNREIDGTAVGDERRWSAGLNYWLAGHNANIKVAYMRIDPAGLPKQHEFTIQLQLYYF